MLRDLTYKWRVTRYHKERVTDKNLAPEDMILRNTKLTGVHQTKGKQLTRWEGSNIIHEEVLSGIRHLGYENG